MIVRLHDLSEEQENIVRAIKEFGAKEIAPLVNDYDQEERFPLEIVRKAQALGYGGGIIPEEYGGAGLDWKTQALMIETFAYYCHVVALCMSAPSGLIGYAIYKHGTEEQKEKYLKPLAEGKTFGAAGVTEPDTGTDVAAMRTTVRKDGDYYILNGRKAWISFLDVCSWVLTFGTMDRSERHKGICAFIIDRDTPGMSFRLEKNKTGFRPIQSGEVILEDVRVHKSNMVGEEKQGFRVAMSAVESGRLQVAARAIGVAQACLDECLDYARERIVFDQPIGKFQLVQSKITDMKIGIESARYFLYRLAELNDKGTGARVDSSMAKMHATDVLMKTAVDGYQIFGAYGCSSEYNVGRYFRDAKIFQIVEGQNDLHRSLIGEALIGLRR